MRERLLGVVLVATGLTLAAGVASEVDQLLSLPELFEVVVETARDHQNLLRTAGYVVCGGVAVVAGAWCLVA